jgi:hypothetical protein
MSRKAKIVALLGLLLQICAPVLALVALAAHLREPIVVFALLWNAAAFLVCAVGGAEFFARITRGEPLHYDEVEDDDETTEPVLYPLTGHQVPGIECDRCMSFTAEQVEFHVSSHVLIVEDCAVCEHIQEARRSFS